jgi:hypothetical protein
VNKAIKKTAGKASPVAFFSFFEIFFPKRGNKNHVALSYTKDDTMTQKQTYADFLTDDEFVRWRLTDDEELENFWKSYISEKPELHDEFAKAIQYFSRIRFKDDSLSESDSNRLLQRIQDSLATADVKKRTTKLWIRYVTAACVALVIGYSTYSYLSKRDGKPVEAENIITGENLEEQDIKLITNAQTTTFASNIDINVGKDGAVTVKDAEGEKQIVTDAEALNKIVVPYGKRSKLELADGTKVWINSGSMLEFPSRFTGKTRSVNVVGEVYLEVAKDGKPFIVHTLNMDVKVYGTAFNVSAYADRNVASVVLVEGKVSVKAARSDEEMMMQPQEMASFLNNRLYKETVDVLRYTSWKDGYLLLNQTPFAEILEQLEQYYNLSFDVRENVNLRNITCTGKIYLSDNLDDVLKTISLLSSTQYERENNKIFIEY